jgi:hypothetical protein
MITVADDGRPDFHRCPASNAPLQVGKCLAPAILPIRSDVFHADDRIVDRRRWR